MLFNDIDERNYCVNTKIYTSFDITHKKKKNNRKTIIQESLVFK